jgi:hypothetical protein
VASNFLYQFPEDLPCCIKISPLMFAVYLTIPGPPVTQKNKSIN